MDRDSLLFLFSGALSFAVGPLVAPVLTLGMPMILFILLRKEEDRESGSWRRLLYHAFHWGMGYGGSLLIKLALVRLFTGPGAGDGISQALMYIAPERGLPERLDMLGYCFMGLIDPWNVKLPILMLILLCFALLIRKKGFSLYQGFFLLSAAALFPVIWIMIVTRHSQHFFVANIMSVFLYGMLSALFFSLPEKPQTVPTKPENPSSPT